MDRDYKIDLSKWEEDKNAKSVAFFSKSKTTTINKNMIEALKLESKMRGKSNARFCLHLSPDESLHDMVILEYKANKLMEPHKHLDKDETIHVLEGEMLGLILDDKCNLISKTILDPKNNFLYRTAKGLYHLWVPSSNYVIFRETVQGPFGLDDNVLLKCNLEKLSEYL